MKVFIRTATGWEPVNDTHKVRIHTEEGIFTLSETMRGDTLKTEISVEDEIVVCPRASNLIQVTERRP